jgi:hypothetical protein
MIQNVLRDIGGIGLYGVISVCLFFLVFSVALVWACLLSKPFLKSMSALPLDDGVRPSPAAAVLPHPRPFELSGTSLLNRVSAPGDGRAPTPTKGVSPHE